MATRLKELMVIASQRLAVQVAEFGVRPAVPAGLDAFAQCPQDNVPGYAFPAFACHMAAADVDGDRR